MKSLLHKYNKYTEYHQVVYHTLLHRFMLFRQGNSSNYDYKQCFKEKIEVIEAYNGGTLFGNIPGDTAQEIKLLELDTNRKDVVNKEQILARGKYLATSFLLNLDRRRYGETIMALKNDCTKQQQNYS